MQFTVELLQKYDLTNIPVHFYSNKDDCYITKKKNTNAEIHISKDTMSSSKERQYVVIAHEVRHAVQDKRKWLKYVFSFLPLLALIFIVEHFAYEYFVWEYFREYTFAAFSLHMFTIFCAGRCVFWSLRCIFELDANIFSLGYCLKRKVISWSDIGVFYDAVTSFITYCMVPIASAMIWWVIIMIIINFCL